MTNKTKARASVRDGISQTKEPVREGLAYLIEDSMERYDVVFAARNISAELAKIAQNIEKIVANDVMPLTTSIGDKLGPEIARKIGDSITQHVRDASAAVQSANTALQGDIDRLEKGIQGEDISDMAMDTGAEEPPVDDMPPADMPADNAPPPSPEADKQVGGLSDLPPPDMAGNAEDDALMGGSFAGRPAKESAKRRGKMIKESPWDAPAGRTMYDRAPAQPASTASRGRVVPSNPGGPTPAIDEHPHKSTSHDANVNNLQTFHGGAFRLAKAIDNMINTEQLSLDQRRALANVLSHMASIAPNSDHWASVDPEGKLTLALKGAGIYNPDETPAVAKIVAQLRRLAHLLSAHHEGLLHENINRLRRAKNPDAIVVEAFRKKLTESRDAQSAAIGTARMFAIDIEDVVSAVREAAARRPFLREFDAEINPKKRGMFKGKTIKDIDKDLTKQHDKADAAKAKGKPVPADVKTKEREDNFAKRAKRHWESAPPPKRKRAVEEEDLLQGVPMFPVEQGSPVQAGQGPQPTNSNPVQPTQMVPPNQVQQQQQQQPVPANQSQSTRKPMSPADLRAARANQSDNSVNAGRPQPADQKLDGASVQPQNQSQMAPGAQMAPAQQGSQQPDPQAPKPPQQGNQKQVRR